MGDYKVETVGEKPTPYVHFALTQRSFSNKVLIARSATDASALLAAMKREVLAIEPYTVFIEGQPMEAQVDAALLPARLAAQTASIVGRGNGARGNRLVRSHRVRGCPANPRDRHPDGARRGTGRRGQVGDATRADCLCRGSACRTASRVARRARDRRRAVRRQRDGSHCMGRWNVCGAAVRRGCELYPRAPGFEDRPIDGLAERVGATRWRVAAESGMGSPERLDYGYGSPKGLDYGEFFDGHT